MVKAFKSVSVKTFKAEQFLKKSDKDQFQLIFEVSVSASEKLLN